VGGCGCDRFSRPGNVGQEQTRTRAWRATRKRHGQRWQEHIFDTSFNVG